jgi:hypothetical protein
MDIELKFELKIPVGSMHNKPASGAPWRSQSGRWFGGRVIDLDLRRLLAHDLLWLFRRWHSSSNLALAGSSPRGSNIGTR